MYVDNPYVDKISIGIYAAELDEILHCVSIYMAIWNGFNSLLNRGLKEFYFRGVRLYIAPNKNEAHILIGKNLDVNITNQELNKEK